MEQLRTAKRVERAFQLRQLQENSLSMSQAGQDLWVYGNVFDEKRDGYFVDLGAHDGVYLSNTFILERRYGWKGILIEANPKTFGELISNRSSTCVHACVSSKPERVRFCENSTFGGIVADDCDTAPVDAVDLNSIEMEAVTLESILDSKNAPEMMDYLSVDIEGAEDRALLEFPFHRYRFTCISIERPSRKLREVFKAAGYLIVGEIPGLDVFYVHESHQQTYFTNSLSFYKKSFAFVRR